MTIVMPSESVLNAAQEPRPMRGGMDQLSTSTLTSLRALVTLKTFSSEIIVPFTPMICSMRAVSKAACALDARAKGDAKAMHRNGTVRRIIWYLLLVGGFPARVAHV